MYKPLIHTLLNSSVVLYVKILWLKRSILVANVHFFSVEVGSGSWKLRIRIRVRLRHYFFQDRLLKFFTFSTNMFHIVWTKIRSTILLTEPVLSFPDPFNKIIDLFRTDPVSFPPDSFNLLPDPPAYCGWYGILGVYKDVSFYPRRTVCIWTG